jgi:predicted NAD/FAD-dependent oxidoreductase
MDEVRIAVIGAGIAGLACAREIARADVAVTVFERARGLGGRLATRRDGHLAFDQFC